MRYTYTQAMKEAIASVDSRVAYIHTLSFYHASFPQTYRYAISDTDLIIGADTYKGKQFSMNEAEDLGLNITVSNVTSVVFNIFRIAKDSGTGILVEPKLFLADPISATASVATKLFVKSVNYNNSDMVLSAGYPDSSNLKLPKENYTAREHPGIRN